EAIAVPREPAVESVRDRASERKTEQPGHHPPARKNVEYAFDRRRALPRLAVGTHQLQRFLICAGRYPRESRLQARRAGGDHFQPLPTVPASQRIRQPRAHLACAVVHHRVSAGLRSPVGNALLSTHGEAYHWIGALPASGARHARASSAGTRAFPVCETDSSPLTSITTAVLASRVW